ncbi:MAG: FKBP-type peptidyl-prolyl cis-trans isomerase [gamma proteobacterium symbiont of Bathyaustriella thionipta]|nr:FKBP-type peptidyl-prolyl cis-trans isomerase [gamma proteobacterium symbiont of Bathyaustriella thionipta]
MSKDTIQTGKFVSLTYSISDAGGQVMEQSDVPVSYIQGGEVELIGSMDKAIAGKCAGDSVKMKIPPSDGFGDYDESLTFTDNIQNVPPEFRQLGAEVQMKNDSGETKTFYVSKIENGRLTIDGNHPLAGKELIITIKILEVRDATPADQQYTVPTGQGQTIN